MSSTTADAILLPDNMTRELTRIRNLVLAVPSDARTHFAWQTVLDAVWHLESTMNELIRLRKA